MFWRPSIETIRQRNEAGYQAGFAAFGRGAHLSDNPWLNKHGLRHLGYASGWARGWQSAHANTMHRVVEKLSKLDPGGLATWHRDMADSPHTDEVTRAFHKRAEKLVESLFTRSWVDQQNSNREDLERQAREDRKAREEGV